MRGDARGGCRLSWRNSHNMDFLQRQALHKTSQPARRFHPTGTCTFQLEGYRNQRQQALCLLFGISCRLVYQSLSFANVNSLDLNIG